MAAQIVDVSSILWRGEDAVALENSDCRAIVMPRRGGKIASLVYKPADFEALAQSRGVYPPLSPGLPFCNGDASGFDDCFPTVSRESVSVGSNNVVYPDHGEIWTAPFEYEHMADGLHLRTAGRLLPYSYEKTARLTEAGFAIDYSIRNTGTVEFPCLWLCHCLLRYEADMRLEYPTGVRTALNVMPSGGVLGDRHSVHPLTGGGYDFTRVPPPDSGTAMKIYLSGAIAQGICGVRYPSSGVKLLMRYDADKLPYLGLWLTAGGYRGDNNLAFEPATSWYDSVTKAMETGTAVRLKPGDSLEFSITLQLSPEGI